MEGANTMGKMKELHVDYMEKESIFKEIETFFGAEVASIYRSTSWLCNIDEVLHEARNGGMNHG